jgi:hypothetical protein
MTEPKDILIHIENIIDNINQTKIEDINVNSDDIDKQFKILEAMIFSKPINISTQTNNLVPIKTKEKCHLCNRTAEYITSEQNIIHICWIHSQEPQNYSNMNVIKKIE